MNKLTHKQQAFCDIYLNNGFVATQAAVAAGFSKKNADKISSQLLGKTRVKEYIDKNMALRKKKMESKFDWVIKRLEVCAELAMPFDEKTGIAELKNHKALLGALSEMNKMIGHYAPDKSINAHMVTETEQDKMSDLIKKYEREY